MPPNGEKTALVSPKQLYEQFNRNGFIPKSPNIKLPYRELKILPGKRQTVSPRPPAAGWALTRGLKPCDGRDAA